MTFFVLYGSEAGDPKPVIEALSPNGKVNIVRNKVPLNNVGVGTNLEVGDEISTDSNTAVDIRYPDESLIRLGFNTQFIIQKLEREKNVWISIHNFVKGNVRALVRKLAGKGADIVHFELRTRSGTIGVRGTEFVAQYFPETGKTRLYTLEGKVLLGAAGIDFRKSKQFVEVSAGEESSVEKNGKVTAPKAFDSAQYQKGLQGSGSPFSGLAYRMHGMRVAMAGAGQHSAHAKAEVNTEVVTAAKKAVPETNKPDLSKKLLSSIQKASSDSINANKIRVAIDDKTAKSILGLLKQGADANVRDDNKNSALMLAALGGLSLTAQALIENKAELNATNEDKESALFFAAKTCQVETISVLITNGANKKLKNKQGYSACVIATPCSNEVKAQLCN